MKLKLVRPHFLSSTNSQIDIAHTLLRCLTFNAINSIKTSQDLIDVQLNSGFTVSLKALQLLHQPAAHR